MGLKNNICLLIIQCNIHHWHVTYHVKGRRFAIEVAHLQSLKPARVGVSELGKTLLGVALITSPAAFASVGGHRQCGLCGMGSLEGSRGAPSARNDEHCVLGGRAADRALPAKE